MRGESVTFTTTSVTGVDSEGNDVTSTVATTVDNVLVAPGDVSDLTGTDRPNGDIADVTLYCPKTMAISTLRGAKVTIPRLGSTFRTFTVIGDPVPYPPAITPTAWNLVVRCKGVEG